MVLAGWKGAQTVRTLRAVQRVALGTCEAGCTNSIHWHKALEFLEPAETTVARLEPPVNP